MQSKSSVFLLNNNGIRFSKKIMVLTNHPTIATIHPIKRTATLIQIINYIAASG